MVITNTGTDILIIVLWLQCCDHSYGCTTWKWIDLIYDRNTSLCASSVAYVSISGHIWLWSRDGLLHFAQVRLRTSQFLVTYDCGHVTACRSNTKARFTRPTLSAIAVSAVNGRWLATRIQARISESGILEHGPIWLDSVPVFWWNDQSATVPATGADKIRLLRRNMTSITFVSPRNGTRSSGGPHIKLICLCWTLNSPPPQDRWMHWSIYLGHLSIV